MMKYIKRIHIVCSIACFGLNQNLWSESSRHTQITFFVREYPEFVKEPTNFKEKQDKLSHPSYPHIQRIKNLIDPDIANGIFASYLGYLTLSAPDGQISFPLWHMNPVAHLVVTNRVTPIMMNSTTIAHWQMEEKAPAAMYKMERIKESGTNDPGTNIVYWNVTKESLPKDRIIPFDSITIFAKPENIYVPLGIILTKEDPNLHLPDIYVKPGINKISNALYVLYLRHFFGPVRRALKKEKEKTPQYSVVLKAQ